MVLADHNFGMPGGALGVDLFFTLSGFLITRLLLADKGSPSGYYRRFYTRRALRIAPVYYVTLAIVLAIVASVRQYWWAYVFYLANFPVLPNAFFSPVLGHTWSLATEEQFYLIWPAAVRNLRAATLIRACALCIGVSILFRLAIPHLVHDVVYARYLFAYAPLSRTDGLFVGASVAALADIAPEVLNRFAAKVGAVAAIVVACIVALGQLSFSKMSPLMGALGMPAVALTFGALVWTGATTDGWPGRILRSSALRRIGRVSYALYLFHFPILAVADRTSHDSAVRWLAMHVIATCIAYGLAELSWYILERPINRLKDRFE